MIPINVLWTDGPFTDLAVASLNAYAAHGCVPHVWTYDKHSDPPPYGVWQDANLIIERNKVDQYRFSPTGQLALFADRFSWELIYKVGGWYGHLDLTLNRPLDDSAPYAFGAAHRGLISTALWKAPAGCQLLSRLISAERDLPPTQWHAFMEAWSNAILEEGLLSYLIPNWNNDTFEDEQPMRRMFSDAGVESGWDAFQAIHWWGSGTVGRMTPSPQSFFSTLLGGTNA